MSTKINTIRPIDLTQYNNMMIPKDKLPQRPCEENSNSNEKYNIVAMNRDGNKAEIQEMAKLLSQSKTAEAKGDEETSIIKNKKKPYFPVASFWGLEDGWI